MRQHRIVVADDDPIVVRFLSAVFQDEGFEVRSAADGEKALQVIREFRPDLVIMDLVMPYQDGFEVCQKVLVMISAGLFVANAGGPIMGLTE